MNKLNNKSIFFFLVLYSFLILGFYFGENSTGGAYSDYLNQKEIVKKFSRDFLNTLLTYDENTHRHSPVLLIYLSIFEKFNLNDTFIRFISLQVAPICSIIFYQTLKLKFKNINNNYLFLFSLIFLLSPTVRTLAIWPDSRIYGLTFFIISIYFYILFQKEKDFKFVIGNIFALAISSYLSPNFSVFSLIFFINFFNYYKISNKLLFISLLNIVLALPAIYYLFILDVNFLKIAAIAYTSSLQNLNVANKIVLISTIFFFYFLPFFLIYENKYKFIKKLFEIKNVVFSLILTFVCIYFFSYNSSFYGGGIFFKFSNFLFNNNILLFFIFFISLLLILKISAWSKFNILIFIILIFNNPQLSIFHKYYDPLIWILLLFFFDLKTNKDKIFNPKVISFFYLFSSVFLVLSLFK
jgi:hypothetical protein